MEVLVKTLCILCLISTTVTLQLIPPLIVKPPKGLVAGIDNIATNVLSNINPSIHKQASQRQCFCIPKNVDSQPVTNYINVIDEEVERIVVYLYKINGEVTVYIPNRNKQKSFPEPNFDADDGDILKPVSSESIVDLVDLQQLSPQESFNEDTVEHIEPIYVETNKPKPIIVNTGSDDSLNEHLDFSPSVPNDNSLPDYNNPFDEQTISDIDTFRPSSHSESMNIPHLNQITNLPGANQLQEVTSKPHAIINDPAAVVTHSVNIISNLPGSNQLQEVTSKPHAIINDPAAPVTHNVNIIPDLADSDNIHINPSILLPNSQSQDIQVNDNLNDITNSEDYESIQQISPMLPPELPSYSQPSIQQNLYPLKPISNEYITFYEWFEIQINRVVFYNIDTQPKIIDLRERIRKVLQNNGINVSFKGIVTDSNGKLVKMHNIKLRPILIGSQGDPQNFMDHEINVPKDKASYIQVIEIIQVIPPKLLGTLLMGKVYLPRYIHGEIKVHQWNDNRPRYPVGCITCKQKLPENPYSYPHSQIDGTHYIAALPFGQYHRLPFRRQFNTGQQYMSNNMPFERHPAHQSERRISDNVHRNGLGDIFEGLLGTLGIAPNAAQPTQRLLGGRVPNGRAPGPRKYPNDVAPGFRIIGGNAATSSGIPLVNKGRSGFEEPSHIV